MSTVPAALTALAQRLQASPAVAALQLTDQPPVRILDGPWLDRPSEPDVIVIGWTPDEGQAVELTEIYDMDSSRESYDVVCLASSFSGDTDLPARRTRADALVTAVRAELQADPTLGVPGVARVEITSQSWDQFQTSSGCEVPIQFTVHVEAFRLD